MENNSEQKPGQSVSTNAEDTLNKIAGNRSIIPIAFAAIIVLFFFSFVNFKCNGSKVASVTGFNLVTGTHIKSPMSGLDNMDNFMNNGNSSSKETSKGEKVPSNKWAIIAFLSAIAGVAVFYKKVKKEEIIGLIIGIVGIVSLLLLRGSVKGEVGSEVQNGMVNIEVDFATAYWLSLLLFVVAGGISYLRWKNPQKPEVKNVPSTSGDPEPV